MATAEQLEQKSAGIISGQSSEQTTPSETSIASAPTTVDDRPTYGDADSSCSLAQADNAVRSAVSTDMTSLASPLGNEAEDSADEDVDGTPAQIDLENADDTLHQRRRKQTAKFDAWFSQRAKKIVNETPDTQDAILDDEAQSTKYLMKKQESHKIVDEAREYQIQLFEKAKEKNIIAVLDTGSGKTLIAVLLLQWTIDQELERESSRVGEPHRISFFLVDCVTLVFQQYAVLECNLDHPVERFCGDMGCDLWSRETWEKQFRANRIIVCTAEVLYQCLMHGFIRMEGINLLVFDEAHHAKKDHAYARIIKDFYLSEEDQSKRPKIFGMTASPVDAKVDVVTAAKQLETILHSEIATARDLSLLSKAINRPKEQVGIYEPADIDSETPLTKTLKAKCSSLDILTRPFNIAVQAASELGLWCADEMWRLTFNPDDDLRLEHMIERDFIMTRQAPAADALDTRLSVLKEARELVDQHTFEEPQVSKPDLSPKVLLLYQYLQQRFERPTDDKCIVFVTKRFTARLLSELFSRIGRSHLRVGTLMGARAGDIADVRVSVRQQVLTLLNFRKGNINCLFATSIAEEGLDIPDCNMVIRFDLYHTLIQYIQSRGRARHRNSRYIHMLEHGNIGHLVALQEARRGENLMRDFCEALPEDRLLQGNDLDLERVLVNERGRRIHEESGSGAKLTYGSSLAVLAHFVACLPLDPECPPQATYVLSRQDGQFIYEVKLPHIPGESPISSATGRPSTKKSIARRSAAFEACVRLRTAGYLDRHLLPTIERRRPAANNALLGLTGKKRTAYDMKTKPRIWTEGVGSVPSQLYVMVVRLAQPEAFGRPYQPIALLTRAPLAAFPPFMLHFDLGLRSEVLCSSAPSPLQIATDQLKWLTSFTLRMFEDLFNKIFEPDVRQFPYLLAPVLQNVCESDDCLTMIDWNAVSEVHERDCIPWNNDLPPEFFANRFMVDPLSGAKRYFTLAVTPHLKPEDPVPPGVMVKENWKTTIFRYSTSLWSRQRKALEYDKNQPVIHARKALLRRNWLDPVTEKDVPKNEYCYICPEPLRISPLPPGIASMGYLLPVIMFRLESYLLALEVCQSLQLSVKPDLALEAITKDSENTEQHDSEQISFQGGMGKNYEREELLGDCFLKMATSIALFAQNPDNDEFEFHVKRMLLICNKNLLETAISRKLYEYIRTKSYRNNPRAWYPREPKLIKGALLDKKAVQQNMLGDKTIADVCEAIIGAALLSHHESGNYDDAVRAVTEMVNSPEHTMCKWADYYALYQKPTYQTAQATRSQLDLAAQLEKKDNYHFRYPRLLRSAFMHPSYPYAWESIPSYQRLEFLGDSLLDMACVNYLFHRFGDKDPQWLTEHKMAMVSNRFLGAICAKMGFHKHLRFNGTLVQHQIQDYITEIEEAERQADGGRDYWTSVKIPPKCLPDIVEAYVGAVFVDSEFDYRQVERFFNDHVKWFFEDMSIYDTYANNHPTTHLHNLLSISFGCNNYRLLIREIPFLDGSRNQTIAAVMIHDHIVSEGRGQSGRYAKVRASEEALKLLLGTSVADFRTAWGCDCRDGAEEVSVGKQKKKGGERKAVGGVEMEGEEHVPNGKEDGVGLVDVEKLGIAV
ncbi:MAG: Dicer-like protein 1 [Caeruleum heppii]|nr:MAG: Dicer-like protein 1 [Caeruleum heppii]